jgi:cytochrome c peroxidase
MSWMLLPACLIAAACGSPADREVEDDLAAAEGARPTPAGDALMQRAQALFAAVPDAPPPLDGNEITPAKLELGKRLYFDPRLSASWLISCNTCHNLGLGGVDLMETSIGHGWQKGPRNAPTVLNSVFNMAQFWDGRAADLMEQAMGPVQAAVEMNSTPERTVETLRSIPGYVEAFGAAFPADDDPVTFENMARAIEAFEATLITPDSPFDRYLEGDAAALTAEQRDGLALFIDNGCAACHGGLILGGSSYQTFGSAAHPGPELLPPEDRGRFNVTGDPDDEFAFKVPILRNISITAPYFHTGKVWSLKQAVEVMGKAQLGRELTEEQCLQLTAFLMSLTGQQPAVEYPVLPPHTAETPLPTPSAGSAAGSD